MFSRKLGTGFLMIGLLNLPAPLIAAEFPMSDRQQQIVAIERAVRDGGERTAIKEGDRLDDYVKVGLKNNPGVRAAFYQWKAAFQKVSLAFSLPDPQFSYTEYIEEVETRVGPQERAFSFSQKFPFPDKLWIRQSQAFKASEVAYRRFEKSRLDLVYKVSDAYYEYAYLSKAIMLTQENIQLLKNFENVAQVQYKSGQSSSQDLLKAQVELGKLENELYSLEDLRAPLMARLNALLNLPQDNILPWPRESLEDAALDVRYQDAASFSARLRKDNPELLALSETVEKEKDAVKLAKRDFVPDVTLGVTYIETGPALNPGLADSGKDPLLFMVSVNVPLWFKRINAEVQDAQASLRASAEMLDSRENDLTAQIALVHYKLRDALRQARLYKDALLPKAVQALNATQTEYEGGKADFLSLIDAQRVLLDFQLSYYRYNANFYQRLAELQSLLGEAQKYAE